MTSSGGSSSRQGKRALTLIACGAVLAGFNLRLAIASVPPLLAGLERHPGLSPTAAAVLTALPFVCFSVVALPAPWVLRSVGPETALVTALTALALGTLVRATGSTAALLAGTSLAAAATAVGNVVLPVLIKARFPARIGLLIGLYTAALSVGAALAGGVSVPLAQWLDWQGALGIWAIPPLISLAPLILARRSPTRRAPAAQVPARFRSLLADPLAWQVTLFFGLQAAIVFSGLSWLPLILRSDGYSSSAAGALLALFALGGVPASLTAPVLAVRARDQRVLTVVSAAVEACALAGLLLMPSLAPACVGLFALGQGASFSLAISLIALRSPDTLRSTQLSGMAQAIGYCIAAFGPFTVGILHVATDTWTTPLSFLIVLCLPMSAAGAGAGRARQISGTQ